MKIIGLMIVSFFEIWLLYYLLFGIFWKEEGMRRRDKVNMWSCILILGSMLTFNRNAIFFSHWMFATVIVIVFLSVYFIRHKEPLFIIGCIVTYYALIALLDFAIGFFHMCFLKDNYMEKIYFKTNSIFPVIVYTISRCVIVTIILSGREKFQTVEKNAKKYQNVLIIADLVFLLTIRKCQIIMYWMVVEKDGKNPGSVGGTILAVLAIIIFVMVLIIKYKSIEMQNELLELREKVIEEEYTNLLEIMEKNGQLFHDMKNHFLVLRDYAIQEDVHAILSYIEEIGGQFCRCSNSFWTGNRILDLVLGQKKAVAERKMIDFKIQATRIPSVFIKDSEICALFGNLLDNAIEACESIQKERKWIIVSIEFQEYLFCIHISNSIISIPAKKRGRFISTKQDRNMHGYGLKSVERIVEKYQGIISYELSAKSFQVDISFFAFENEKIEGSEKICIQR